MRPIARILVVTLIAGLVMVLSAGPPASAEQEGSAARQVAAASIATGDGHSCALLTTGSVRCWGAARFGQLGYGNSDQIGDDEVPASAGDVPVGGRAVAITAGAVHTCALLSTGAVRCWGFGGTGQLGYGNLDIVGDDETPASVGDVPIGGRAVAVAAGGAHTCALLTTGAVRCWGFGGDGRLGYGHSDTIGDDETPATQPVVAVGGRAVAVTAGEDHTCALLSTGGLRCWGLGNHGQLGYASTESIGDDETPASVGPVPVGGTSRAVSAGGAHTCALLLTGAVRCWGLGENGRLGHGNSISIGDDETPASAGDVAVGGRATAVAAGGGHTCVVLTSGGVGCWGFGGNGRLGYGNTDTVGDDEAPAAAGRTPVGARAVAVSAGSAHTCAVLAAGGIRCWGLGSLGQLGYGHSNTIGDNEIPSTQPVVPVGGRVRVLAPAQLRVRATPARDRRAPFRFQVTGRVVTDYAGAAVCSGTLSVVVRRATGPRRKVAAKTLGLRADCTFGTRFVLTSSRVPLTGRQKAEIRKVHNSNRPARRKRQLIAAIRRTPLVVTVTLPATTNLAVATTRRKVVVR